ncbi:hypothetical protein [Streptomyces sp. AC495_CC817]|uniref:hypothetical protein n=1 Tax=Streptomyces sp. AC495_CC817 TaxID=2823900 RepID=UPI001C2681E9|nr:hypothetical protein [Streptomyces sp. AC495_CC817]
MTSPAAMHERLQAMARQLCTCWMCNGPARMKLAAWVERAPLTPAQQGTARTFWAKFA